MKFNSEQVCKNVLKNVRLAQRYPDIQNPDVPWFSVVLILEKLSDIGGQE